MSLPTGPSEVAVDRGRRSALRPHRQDRFRQAQGRLDRCLPGIGPERSCQRPRELQRRGITLGIWSWPIRPSWWPISPLPAAAASRARSSNSNAIRGSRGDVYIAPGVVVHPMVVIDAEHGPVYLDEGR